MFNRNQSRDSKILTIIKPQKGWLRIDFKELWDYRELIVFFVWKEVLIKYKQTIIGITWAIFQPFITMVIFSIFFGTLLNVPSDGIPYPIFVYVGLLFWNYFSTSLSKTSASAVGNANFIQKIYFPRLIIPVSSSLSGFVDFLFAALVVIGLMFYFKYVPSLMGVLAIPLLALITFLFSVGLGCFLAPLNVKYRDVQIIVPFFISLLMFLTPVIYPVSILGKYKWIAIFNPMAIVIESARGGILGIRAVNWQALWLAFLISIVFFVVGVMFFRRTEGYFADII